MLNCFLSIQANTIQDYLYCFSSVDLKALYKGGKHHCPDRWRNWSTGGEETCWRSPSNPIAVLGLEPQSPECPASALPTRMHCLQTVGVTCLGSKQWGEGACSCQKWDKISLILHYTQIQQCVKWKLTEHLAGQMAVTSSHHQIRDAGIKGSMLPVWWCKQQLPLPFPLPKSSQYKTIFQIIKPCTFQHSLQVGE